MKSEAQSKKEKEKVEDYNFTKLDDHKVHKKTVKGSFHAMDGLGGFTTVSWIDSKIAEMLWVILLRSDNEQTEFIYMFRAILKHWGSKGVSEIMHSELQNYDKDLISELLHELCATDSVKKTLRPLLLFGESLPLYEIWENSIGEKPKKEDEMKLMTAVDKAFFHQSQEATDCRWARIYVQILYGKVRFAPQLKDTAEKIVEYPFLGDMRSVRPSIRAMEMGIDMQSKKNNDWNDAFWKMGLYSTDCMLPIIDHKVMKRDEIIKDIEIIRGQLRYVFMSNTTPGIDIKLDSIFGFGFYFLNIIDDLCKANNDKNSMSRIALRTLIELYVNLAYLCKMDREDLWKEFRNYGNGESKKAFLKLVETSELPSFIDIKRLHSIANEDVWQEYIDIQLGDWAKSNLRKRAEDSGVKDFYDKYYDITSGYTHGNWSALKEQVYTNCLNPLHKYHRVPNLENKEDISVLPDGVMIFNLVLDLIVSNYSGNINRLDIERYI